jgi:hypothetical protein
VNLTEKKLEILYYLCKYFIEGRFQRLRFQRRGSAPANLLGLRFRVPPPVGCLPLESVVLCEAETSLCRVDHSSRGVLTSVVCLSVIVKPQL